MNEYERIKKSINKKKNHPLLKFFELICLLLVFLLSFMIYAKNDENGSFLNKYFSLNVSFKSFNDEVGYYLSKFLANFNIFTKDDESKKVSGTIYYQVLGDDYYSYESNNIPLLYDGKIVNISQIDDAISISVYYQNGITANYYELTSSFVNKEDIVSLGENIGTYEERFKTIFQIDNQIISYEEVLLYEN